MSAYHWEARRRQIMLDRQQALQARIAREKQKHEEAAGKALQKHEEAAGKTLQKHKETAGKAPQPQKQPCPDPESQQPAPVVKEGLNMESYQIREGAKESRCPCNTDHMPNHSGKLMKRYSDYEYIQQW